MDEPQSGARIIVPPAALQRIGHAPLVGRERELAVLDAEIADSPGTPHALLLTGEPGIGKSRLLREAQARVTAAGWRSLSGGAEEEVGAIPYLPWQPILRALLSERAPDDDAPHARDMVAVRALVSVLEGDASPSPPVDIAETPISEERKLRLYDALVRLLAFASEVTPILITLDDVQWLDSASADLLRYVALHGSGRLLLLLAARTEELPRNVVVSGALDDINRARRLSTHTIPRFTLRETAALLAAVSGSRDDRLAQSLHERSDGNPFLLEETLKALAEGDEEGLPLGVVALVDRRLRRVSSDALQLVRAAALLGRRFPLSVVAALSPAEPERLADLLDEAIAATVLLLMRKGPAPWIGVQSASANSG
jgi:predicted ATPase